MQKFHLKLVILNIQQQKKQICKNVILLDSDELKRNCTWMCYWISETCDLTHQRSDRSSCVLLPPTPSVAGVHRLVSLFFRGPLKLRGGHRGPPVCLCNWPLRLPLSGQGAVTSTTGRGRDTAPCQGPECRQRSSTLTPALALAPSLAACFLWGFIRHPGLPLCWRLGQHFALGCQADICGEALLEGLESKGFIH